MDSRIIKRQMTAAYQYSHTRLALNYCSFFDSLSETTGLEKDFEECTAEFVKLLSAYRSGDSIEDSLEKLRERITHQVEILTSYTDCFQIYEYVLNRIERRFTSLPECQYNDETFAQLLINYIKGGKDSSLMNSRIQQVISQLPVRFTKQKFFSMVMEGLSVYIGSPKENLEDMMYILRTESMAQLPQGMKESHPKLYEILDELCHADYRNLDKDRYDHLMARFQWAGASLVEESSLYLLLQDLVNDLYVLLLARDRALADEKEEALLTSIIGDITQRFEKADFSPADQLMEQLTALEGRQEAYYERYLKTELPEASSELLQDPEYVSAVKIDRLLSGSPFADLEAKTEEGEEELTDRAYMEGVANAYFKELEEVFGKNSRPVVRSIMAKVLSDLPICFNSLDEIQDYIRGSLESCADSAEKETSMELLEELMEDENNLA